MDPIPIVFIHGLFGWGNVKPFFNLGPSYWPECIFKMNFDTILVQVGIVSSDYDRSCEVFYQLKGGRVDYGLEHSNSSGHDRYGAEYANGLYPDWGKNHPIHIIGHSCGSTTAIELYQMLCQDAFKVGSDASWVKSITSIAGPLTGTTLVKFAGVNEDSPVKMGSMCHVLGIGFGLLWWCQKKWPILKCVFDLRMPQWRRLCRLKYVFQANHPLTTSKDNAYHNLLPGYRIKRNGVLRDMEKVHLFSVVCQANDRVPYLEMMMVLWYMGLVYYGMRRNRIPKLKILKWLLYSPNTKTRASLMIMMMIYLAARISHIDLAHLPIFKALTWLLKVHCKTLPSQYPGFDKSMWRQNDGIVNTYSMVYPRKSSNDDATPCIHKVDSYTSVDLSCPTEKYRPGRWYIYRIARNHFCGTSGDSQAHELYEKLFKILHHLH